MNWLRALLVGVLLWVLIFVEISITMIGLGLEYSTVWMIHYVVLIAFGVFCSWLYYRNKDKVNGFVLGIFMVIVSMILDMIVTVPFFIMPDGGSYASYFADFYMWVGVVELILITGIYKLVKR